MFNLTIAVLIVLSVLLLWPAEGVHRLQRLRLPGGATPQASPITLLRSRRSQRRLRSVRAIDALSSLEAELQSGQPPSAALMRAAGEPAAWPSALAALRIGGDVAAALRADAHETPVLGQLAACWEVASHTGSGLSQSVAVLAESARTKDELEGMLNAELAGPRATTRVLMLLPAFGVLLGIGLGADPLGWLSGNPFGLLCAACGLLLTGLGGLWSRLLVRKVERQL